MPDRGEARASADKMLEIISRLQEGESAKRAMVLGTPEFLDKAKEVETLARLAFRWSQLQLQLAERGAIRGPAADAVPLTEVRP